MSVFISQRILLVMTTAMRHHRVMNETEGVPGPAIDAERKNAKFGDANVQMLPLSVIISLRQMRESVDNEALQTLKARIVLDKENGELHYNLVHPVTVNLLDREHLGKYLADHDEYYGESSQLDPDELPVWNGYYVIRVAGHMRGEVAVSHCKDQGVALQDADISAAIHVNQSFIDANRTQNIENTRVEVSPVDDARSIERHYAWCVRRGEPADIATIANYFGYSHDKVRAALRFVTAPKDIQEFVGKGLSYSAVVALVRLREAYEHTALTRLNEAGETIDISAVNLQAAQSMRDYFEITVRRRLTGRNSAYISDAIEAKIKEVQKTAEYYTDELFLYNTAIERALARTKVRRELGSTALLALSYLLQQKDLQVSDIDRLEQLVAEARKQAAGIDTAKAPPEAEASLF